MYLQAYLYSGSASAGIRKTELLQKEGREEFIVRKR